MKHAIKGGTTVKFALNENTLITCDLMEFLSASAEAGFSAVELSYPRLKEALRFVPAMKIREQIEKLDLRLLSLNAFEDVFLVPEQGVSIVEAEAALIGELCQAVGCPAVVLPSSRWYLKYGELPDADNLTALYQSRLLRVKKVLDRYGVESFFEPIAYPEFITGTVEEVNALLDHDELRNLRLAADIHNLFRNRQGPEQLLQFSNPIGLFHIDDTVAGELETLHVAFDRTYPGQGTADAGEWVRFALASGYAGYFSLELFNNELYEMDPFAAAALCMKQLQAFAESAAF
jgi:sugar phosphate isomerase/epimerase